MIGSYCIDELDWRWDWTGKGRGIGPYNTEVLYRPKLVVVVLPTVRLRLSLKDDSGYLFSACRASIAWCVYLLYI